MLFSCVKIFEASSINSVDPDQTVPVGAVLSRSTLFFYILTLSNKHIFSDVVILLVF